MTARIKSGLTKIEVEIEKSREESNWLRVIELAEQMKEKSPDLKCLWDFLIGEGKLENFLEECPPIEANVKKARYGLIDAKRYLNLVITEDGIRAEVAMDAHLLLGKLQYACGHYADGLKHFKLANLQNLPKKKLPLRNLRIIAESYAIKGLCLQKDDTASSKFKKAEKQEELVKCFDLASDLGLLYMQNVEKELTPISSVAGSHSPQLSSPQKSLSAVLEVALGQAPEVLLQQDKADQAVERYRNTLCAAESSGTHNLRLKFMCQMAELLLRGVAGENYRAPAGGAQASKGSVWKPKCYFSINQFVPRNECEETILLLLVAESMAVRNAVLSQSPEFKEARLSAYHDATMVYDLLTVATVRWGQIALLEESLERSMKFSFEEVHLWKQHALSLISTGEYNHALAVLQEVIRLEPNNPSNYLIAAKLCYEHLGLAVDGTNFSLEAREKAFTSTSGVLFGRAHLFIGMGYYLQAESSQILKEKEHFKSRASDNFRSAVELEPNDHLSRYYLGLQLAINGHIAEAQQHIRFGVELHPDHSSSLHLLVLLLTAERQHKSALAIVENALEEYPDCLNLMYVKAFLELHEKGGEVALLTAKQMLELWKNLYENQTNSDIPECDRKSDTRSVFQLYTSEMSDKDSSSLQAHNAAVSRVEQALSEVASSMSSFSLKPGPQRAWMLQVEVWLLLAELYLTLGQSADVQMCIQEATQLYPLSHHIMHMKGLLHMHREEWPEAKLCFQNAVAINPHHVKSLQQLGLVYHYLDLQGLAESTLREAARIEPRNYTTWYNLGKVLEALGEYEKAASAMATALMEEKNSPILPFNSVPLCFE